jgi:hypothetical protein
MKCSVTVGETVEYFEVDDDLLTSAFATVRQDSAARRVSSRFTTAYRREMERLEGLAKEKK